MAINDPENERDDNTPENEISDNPPALPEREVKGEISPPDKVEADIDPGEDVASESEGEEAGSSDNEGDENSFAIEAVEHIASESEERGDGAPPENEAIGDSTSENEKDDNSIEIEVVVHHTPEDGMKNDNLTGGITGDNAQGEDTTPEVEVIDDSTSANEREEGAPESDAPAASIPPSMVMEDSVPIEDQISENGVRVVDYNDPPKNEGRGIVQGEDSASETDLRDNAYALDDSAEQLYRQFAGIDDADRADTSGPSHSELMELLSQEEKQLDYYRLTLAQATCIFADILTNSRFASLAKENDQKIKVFLGTLKKLSGAPKFDGTISCRLRGQQRPNEAQGQQPGDTNKIGEAETYDYQLSCGNLLLDHEVARSVELREKVKGAAIYSKLMAAFKGMSLMNIFNFAIDIGKGEEEDFLKIEKTIECLVHFYNNESDKSGFFVKDEYGQPNINLTLLAATNKARPAALQSLVNKIKVMMFGEEPAEQLKRFTTVYDVILASKRYREQLKKMPIEVNNMQTLMKSLHNDTNRTTEAVQVTRLVLAKYGSNPRMASEVISSINSEGYSEIRADIMGKRLSLATGFLKLTEDSKDKHTLQNEALRNIEDGLDRAPDEIYDNINIEDGQVSTVNEHGKSTKLLLHEKLSGMIGFFKQRSNTKKKVRDITNKNIKFNADDYAVIARNFDVTQLEAAHLIDLMRNCFNDKGRFLRNFFVRNIPEFIKYDIKVFEFLWHYLKGLDLEEDRVSFLNGLQLLVPKLNRPEEALKVLLDDIFTHSAVVKYYDRNGLMLANILIRTKNREEKSNIELTPEEVLLVRKSLDQEKVKIVQDFFDEHNEHLMRKIRHITEAVIKSASRGPEEKGGMETRFLLHLNRELVIFLALVGGEKAKAIIHGSISEFGQPASSYYKEMVVKPNLKHSLQFLQVAVRALRRFEDPTSSYLIEEVASREVLFVNLWPEEPSYPVFVKRIMDRIMQRDGG